MATFPVLGARRRCGCLPIIYARSRCIEVHIRSHCWMHSLRSGCGGIRIHRANGSVEISQDAGCRHESAYAAFALRQSVDLYRHYHQMIAQVDTEIETYMQQFEDQSDGQELPQLKRPSDAANERTKVRYPLGDARKISAVNSTWLTVRSSTRTAVSVEL